MGESVADKNGWFVGPDSRSNRPMQLSWALALALWTITRVASHCQRNLTCYCCKSYPRHWRGKSQQLAVSEIFGTFLAHLRPTSSLKSAMSYLCRPRIHGSSSVLRYSRDLETHRRLFLVALHATTANPFAMPFTLPNPLHLCTEPIVRPRRYWPVRIHREDASPTYLEPVLQLLAPRPKLDRGGNPAFQHEHCQDRMHPWTIVDHSFGNRH